MKVIETSRDVLVVLRHDPANSDPVDVAMVLDPELFEGQPNIKVWQEVHGSKTQTVEVDMTPAEVYAINREIEYLKTETTKENGCDPVSIKIVQDLTLANFTKKTDLWFEVIEMPLITGIHNA